MTLKFGSSMLSSIECLASRADEYAFPRRTGCESINSNAISRTIELAMA